MDPMTNHSINNEPCSERPKMESVGSTSPKRNDIAVCPILILPPDILGMMIIHKIPVPQWPSLELLDTNFGVAALMAWRQLRYVDLNGDFFVKSKSEEETDDEDDGSSFFDKTVRSILHKLIEYSPFLKSISGIDMKSDDDDAELNLDTVQLLAQFEHLESITIGNCIGVELEAVVEFLESTRSRTTLKELHLCNVDQQHAERDTILDQFASSFANGRDIRSPLKLEKFSFTSIYRLHIRLDTLDTSRLTDLRFGKTWIEPDQLANLIERASGLERIELAFIYCCTGCTASRLQDNKNLLLALASRENLAAIKFGRRQFGGRSCDCTKIKSECIEMLKTIGRRGKLRKLAFELFFLSSDEICATISSYVPNLQSIDLRGVEKGGFVDIIGLMELEEIHLTAFDESRLPEDAMSKIAQLPRLKRLALDIFSPVFKKSLKRLADAPILTDLRISNTVLTGGDLFDTWSVGFASNLQILMLSRIELKGKHDETGLVRLLKKAVHLRVLILHGNVSDYSLMAIAKSCPKLEILGIKLEGLSGARLPWTELCVRQLQIILDRCPRLKQLGGFGDKVRKQLKFLKYRKIGGVCMRFWEYDFDDSNDH